MSQDSVTPNHQEDAKTNGIHAAKEATKNPPDTAGSSEIKVEKPAINELNLNEDATGIDMTQVLYNGFANAFGSLNPFQMFSMCWPGTVLDESNLSWEPAATGNIMPPNIRTATSQILDMYIPPSPISQPDGSLVSERYASTIRQLGPIPNPALLNLQRIIRDKLNKTIVVDDNGKEIEVTVTQWYDRLNANYIAAKRAWSVAQTNEKNRLSQLFPGQPLEQNNRYLDWYAINADTYQAAISSAHNIILAEFPLREWESAIAILNTGTSYALTKANELIQNIAVPIPNEYGGGSYAPTFGIPNNWSSDLATSVGELDLLASPVAKFQAVSTAIRSLEAEAQAWGAIMPDVTDEEVRLRLAEFQAALANYQTERTKLTQEWTESVYVVVEAVAAYTTSTSTTSEKFIEAMTNTAKGDQDLTQNLANAFNAAYGTGGGTASYNRVTDLVRKLTDQQNGVWAQQEKTLSAGASLAGAATTWLENDGRQTNLKWIFSYISQLNTRLDSLKSQQGQLIQSSMIMWKQLFDPTVKQPKSNSIGAYLPLTEETIPDDLNAAKKITPRKDFDVLSQPDPYSSAEPDTWTTLNFTLSKSQMESNEQMKTTFTRRQWGVNFFFGSIGGVRETQTSNFANEFMSQDSEIKVGLLAKKVVIRRNWMLPTVLQDSQNYFRVGKTGFMLNRAIDSQKLKDDENIQAELQNCSLPCYPVSFLIVKDVSIKMNFDFSHTERVKDFAKTVSSSGGGFFCFNSSSASSSTNSFESVSMNVEAGELELKFKSPQIIGYYLQISPPDESKELSAAEAEEITSAIRFLNEIKDLHQV